MAIEVKIPSVGESISEVTISAWIKQSGEMVEMDAPICEIESDKATVELVAEEGGVLEILVEEGETVPIGAVIGKIDSSKAPTKKPSAVTEEKSASPKALDKSEDGAKGYGDKHPSPSAQRILAEKNIGPQSVEGTGKGGRITKGDALAAKAAHKSSPGQLATQGARSIERKKMTSLRKTIAKRLVEAKNMTAMLSTFNEVDMYEVMALRKKYQEQFVKKYGIKLGFMSLFTRAVTQALKEFPSVNASIEGDEMLFHDYADIGIAVSTPKGLVVPVVRNAQSLSLAQIETEIVRLAGKARDGKLTIDEMTGGTFTITNGGVFGSMLSTPIINIPQSAILGMHNIVQRPMAIAGQVAIRPVMYVALSYDHRIIDGRESVGFLKSVKEYIECPAKMLLEI